jgi:release factor glutamine methyltransferase
MVQFNYKDFLLEIPKNIYPPMEDTFLMMDSLKEEFVKNNKSFLEIGAGSGIISLTAHPFFRKVMSVDIDENVIDHLEIIKKKYSLENQTIVQSDLFSNVLDEKFDVIVFNPPYVPSEEVEVLSTDGGEDGSEIILRFIPQLPNFLKEDGVCYLLVSSHNNLDEIYYELTYNQLSFKKVLEKNIFFENLIVLKVSGQ